MNESINNIITTEKENNKPQRLINSTRTNNKPINELRITIPSNRRNESLARSIAAAFCLPANPTVEFLEDIKTAVSEVVTNAIVHAYEGVTGDIDIHMTLYSDRVLIAVRDYGKGIDNIEKAMAPFFTTKSIDERSGMGFTIMESFMDELSVVSDGGVEVTMMKKFQRI